MNFDRSHTVIAPKCYSFFDVKTSAKDGQIRKIQPCISARLKIDTSAGANNKLRYVIILGEQFTGKWCWRRVRVLCVSTIPTLYLKLYIESHVLTYSSRTRIWSTQWST